MGHHRRTIPLIAALLAFLFSTGHADEVYSKTRQANNLYKQGKFEEALKLYEDALLLSPSDEKLKMNKGSALYQTGDLEGAEQNYQGALSAKENKTRATAHYNMGNILYRKGDMLQQQGDPSKAQEEYKKALEHYIQSLKLKPSDFDAKWNLQLAHQRIQQMEQQQQQQQNQKDDNKDQKDKNDQQQQQNSQNQDKDQQNKDQQDKQDQQDKKDDQNKEDQEKQQQQNDKKEDEQQQQQQAEEQKDDDMKKEEAKRLLELYADDADSLNKPTREGIGKQQQPERDW